MSIQEKSSHTLRDIGAWAYRWSTCRVLTPSSETQAEQLGASKEGYIDRSTAYLCSKIWIDKIIDFLEGYMTNKIKHLRHLIMQDECCSTYEIDSALDLMKKGEGPWLN
jgi:hypothetical protein